MDTTPWAICNSQFLFYCTALRTRGLNLSLSCISVCVNQLLESTHLITDKGGGHIPDDEYKSNKHTDTKDFWIFTWHHFEPRTLVWRQLQLDIRTFLWSCFCKTFFKKLLYTLGAKLCLDQIKLADQLLMWAKLGFVLLDNDLAFPSEKEVLHSSQVKKDTQVWSTRVWNRPNA